MKGGTAQVATLSREAWQLFEIQTKGQDENRGKGVKMMFVYLAQTEEESADNFSIFCTEVKGCDKMC